MKTRLDEQVLCIVFCAFLGIMAALFWLLPKESYSELEKKVLASMPDLTVENLLSGKLDDELELYMSEHLPGRTFFVGIHSYYSQFTGRQVASDIYVAQGDRLVEKPVQEDSESISKKIAAIQAFAQSLGQQVDFMIIPSAGWAAEGMLSQPADPYQDDRIIAGIYGQTSDLVRPADVTSLYQGHPELYYRTDHHWTTEGAYTAYQAYMTSKAKPIRSRDDFSVTKVPGFYGSTYSRSGLWLTPPDTLELWNGSNDLTVITTKPGSQTVQTHDSVFFPERLNETDKYTVYLDGNNSIVRIQNPNAEGRILVIRDSYSNCLGTLLAESYAEVVLVDLRYYNIMTPVSDLCKEESFDDILVCYSLSNFMTDGNLPILR